MSHSIFKLKLRNAVKTEVEYCNPNYVIHFFEEGENEVTGLPDDKVEFLEITLGREPLNKFVISALKSLRIFDLDYISNVLVEVAKIFLRGNE